jgi:3alpha(or 20beta)-hydroxysteroid dehydrogenase
VDKQALNATLPASRAGHAKEVAQMVVFLASDDSSYCTGSGFIIDGGATAGIILPRQS